MTGAMVAVGPCWACGRNFLFDPELVCSISICAGCDRPPDMHEDSCTRNHESVSRPLCLDCVAKANEQRALINRPQVQIRPGAYFGEDGRPIR